VLNLERFDLIEDNVAIFEQAETERLVGQVQEDLAAEAAVDPATGDVNELPVG
jgi:hypothetical protein